jgi:hypothetical protein
LAAAGRSMVKNATGPRVSKCVNVNGCPSESR